VRPEKRQALANKAAEHFLHGQRTGRNRAAKEDAALSVPPTRRSLTQLKARRSRLMTHASSLTQLKARSSLMTQAISLTQLKACRSRLMIHASSLTQLKACISSLMTLPGNQPDSTQGVQKPPDDTCKQPEKLEARRSRLMTHASIRSR